MSIDIDIDRSVEWSDENARAPYVNENRLYLNESLL